MSSLKYYIWSSCDESCHPVSVAVMASSLEEARKMIKNKFEQVAAKRESRSGSDSEEMTSDEIDGFVSFNGSFSPPVEDMVQDECLIEAIKTVGSDKENDTIEDEFSYLNSTFTVVFKVRPVTSVLFFSAVD